MTSEVKYNATKLFYPSKDFYRGIHKLLQDSSFSPKIAKHFFRDNQRINLVQSRPCKENEKMTYDFTGNNAKVIDGKFEGPGKLTIHQVQAGIAKLTSVFENDIPYARHYNPLLIRNRS